MATIDVRTNIVNWARWSYANRARFIYTEGPTRMADEHRPAPGKGPITCDCSAFVTYCYCWAGVTNDPNGQNWDREGFTGTLLAQGQHIAFADALPGDVVIYGPGTGVHAALIVEKGADESTTITASMGHPGDPEYVSITATEPYTSYTVTYLRFNTTSTVALPPPPRPATIAAKLGPRFRPLTPLTPPILQYGPYGKHSTPLAWDIYGRQLLHKLGVPSARTFVGPIVRLGHYGRLTKDAVREAKTKAGIPFTGNPVDNDFTLELWRWFGVEW